MYYLNLKKLNHLNLVLLINNYFLNFSFYEELISPFEL